VATGADSLDVLCAADERQEHAHVDVVGGTRNRAELRVENRGMPEQELDSTRGQGLGGRSKPGHGLVSARVEQAHDDRGLPQRRRDREQRDELLSLGGRDRVLREYELGPQQADAFGGCRETLVARTDVDVHLEPQLRQGGHDAGLLLGTHQHPCLPPCVGLQGNRIARRDPYRGGAHRGVEDHGLVVADRDGDARSHER
jgi:hypothetical protein